MATKLKKMRLTSVDLVRSGANQEADICLYKSADPPEATESPTEAETNIFKRFLNWLRENPTEAENEPQNPIEKADDLPDIEFIYKSALAESLQSIMADDTLTEIEKKDMTEESLRQYAEKIQEMEREEERRDDIEDRHEDDHDDEDDDPEDDFEEELIEEIVEVPRKTQKSDDGFYDYIEESQIRKYNHNHGSDGKFSSSPGTGGGAGGAKLGDFVDYGKEPHVVINETKETVTLRPVSRYGGNKDFDGGGDSFGDVHLDKWQMKDVEVLPPAY